MRSLTVLLLLLYCQHGVAHKVLTMIYSTGLEIEGQVAFSNGEFAAPGTLVDAYRNGKKVASIRIGEQGSFVYKANQIADYRFVANLGSGHVAELVIKAAELSAQDGADSSDLTIQAADALKLIDIEKALARQIRPLRQEIQALKEKQRFTDILGGIGFIVGIFGLIAWWQSRRK